MDFTGLKTGVRAIKMRELWTKKFLVQKKIGQKFGGRQKFRSKKILSKKFVPKIIFVKENVASKIMLVQYMTIQKNDGARTTLTPP